MGSLPRTAAEWIVLVAACSDAVTERVTWRDEHEREHEREQAAHRTTVLLETQWHGRSMLIKTTHNH
jgi:hypothetical protein